MTFSDGMWVTYNPADGQRTSAGWTNLERSPRDLGGPVCLPPTDKWVATAR